MKKENVVIITPCFNENTTVIAFLKQIEEVAGKLPFLFEVIVVDDCSSDQTLSMLQKFSFVSENITLTILPLRFNVGHQSAIYQGLLYAQHLDADKFIIMDSDGEDDPEAIAELVKFNDYDIVNVARGRRKESISFQISYYVYRFIFKIITGKILNFGNFCMIKKKVLETSCHTSFIHFAAHLSKQKVKSTSITFNRLKRIDGKSKMNLTSLVHHAFKSFVEYAEELLMVFLRIFILVILLFFGIIGVVLYKKLFTDEAILGWASTMTVNLFTAALVCVGFFVMGILLLNMISRRNQNKTEIFVKLAEKSELLNQN
ncbi:glycosyltransferase [Pedobacter gandavensis]|uniref:glycosyltransferase n=1 Tax=Pedobacter gandavensis TaxID=2679963 RepID=UPI00292D9116|nr:glycosyltransferase [Pedobacter gandavensis]